MAGLDDILKMLPIEQIASKLGVDPATAQQAVQQGGGAILTGLQRNAQTPEGSSAIEKALGNHTGLGDSVDIDSVDTDDGDKILGHVFGGQQQEVADKLTKAPETAGIDFGKLLPMLAPIIMGLLSKGQQQQQAPAGQAPAEQAPAGGGLGGLIGGLLGGGQAQSGGGIGDVIGGLLGGGQGGSGGGIDIGAILGGLLGGKK